MVLGRITAQVHTLPVIGEPHVVVGRRPRLRGPQDVHRRDAATTPTARWSAAAEHVWIAIDPAAFG